MQKFASIMQAWPGRRVVQSTFEGAGFNVHRSYQDSIAEACRVQNLACDVDLYWDACADEWMRACVFVDSDKREFRGRTAYRSAYLDALAENAAGRKSIFPSAPLHPCLFEIYEEDEKHGLAFIKKVGEAARQAQLAEVRKLAIDAGGWDNSVPGLKSCTANIAKAFGFEQTDPRKWDAALDSNGYVKIRDDGLIFYFGFEEPKRVLRLGQLPLRFEVTYKAEPPNPIYLHQLNVIIPGCVWYSLFQNPQTAILGIQAFITAFNILAESIPVSIV